MKKVTKTYRVFSFNELSKDAQNRAINDEVNAGIELAQDGDIYWQACEKAEKNRTPWFAGSIAYQDNEQFILESLRNLGECFLVDGSYFSI